MAEWEKVAQVGDIAPGEMKLVKTGEEPIVLTNVDGNYFAFSDICTHEMGSLSEGFLEGQIVTCPMHGSEFNVRTGEPVGPPADEPIATYQVRIEGQDIFIALP